MTHYSLGFGSGYYIDADAKTLFDRGTFDDISVRTAINNMIIGLKRDGVWSKLDVLNVVSPIEADSLLNVVTADYDSTVAGSVAFTADLGFTTTNVPAQDDNIDIDLNPTVDSVNFARDTNSLGCYYNLDAVQYSLNEVLVGLGLAPIYAISSSEIGTFNHNSSDPKTVTASDIRGFVASSRTAGSGSDNLNLNYRGTESLSTSTPDAGLVDSAVAGVVTDARIAMWFFGGAMTNTELNYVKARTEAYLATRGATY